MPAVPLTTHWIRCFFRAAVLFPVSLVALDAWGAGPPDDLHPTATEIALLPRFCWAQMHVPDVEGPEFNLPQPSDCGWATNHYCLGLVDLNRAKHATNKGQRMTLLGLADADTRYTERAIKDYPNCSLREHVEASRAEINHLLRLYGGKPIDSK